MTVLFDPQGEVMVRAPLVPVVLVCCSLVAQTPKPAQDKRLSLRDAIQTALENNLQVTIAQQTREKAKGNVTLNEGAFDWNLAASLQSSRQDSASSGINQNSGQLVPSTSTNYGRSFDLQLGKKFAWGGNLSFDYAPSYSYSRTTYGNLNYGTPLPYTGSLGITYTQSLLKGLGTEASTVDLIVARKSSQKADYTFQQSIIGLVASTEGLYWDMVYAQRDLENKRVSLELAQRQLKENTIRVEVGTMAPIEVTAAEAQVAKAEQDIISAEASLQNARDALMRALYPNGDRPAGLELTDGPTLGHILLNEDGAVKMALERRVELKAARLDLESSQVQERATRNRMLPQLDAFVSYNGKTDSRSGWGTVNSDLTESKFPGYTVGMKFAIPIQNRAAKGSLSMARATTRTSELSLRDQELGVALEVRKALRNVEAAEKGVKAAEKSRFYQEKNLEAERKKFENGMSTNFVVLQTMTNLDQAKSSELNAQIAYAKAVTALEVAVGNLMEARKFAIK
jgi:outer membrane protein TolC